MTPGEIPILAFLQNQWFPNPERVKAIYARHANDPVHCAKLRAAHLFMGCLTGKRIRAAFGDDMRHEIVYAEASPEIGGHASSSFKADPSHIASTIEFWKPKIVIGFGRIAGDGVMAAMRLLQGKSEFYFTLAPHPAARHASVRDELSAVALDVKSRLGLIGGAA